MWAFMFTWAIKFPLSLTTHIVISQAQKVQGIFGSRSHHRPPQPLLHISQCHIKQRTRRWVCQMQISLLIIWEKVMTWWQGLCQGERKKTAKIEGEKEGKPQERICNSSWCFPSFGWLLTVRQAVPHRALVFPLGPPSRPRGEVENCNPTPSKCSLLNTHIHTRTHTHTQQLSTGKAGDRMRSPFTAALVRRGVQMGSCYTLIVG